MEEVPWPEGPYPAWLHMDDDGYEGFLHFKSPKYNSNESIRVTLGPSYKALFNHVWHMEHHGRQLIVSPSIHYVSHFHTPNPVTFRLISRQEYNNAG